VRIVNGIARFVFCIVVALLIPAGVQGLADQTLSSNVTSGIGVKGGYESYSAGSFSSDGRFVAFDSDAADLVAGDTNGWRDVFVKDRQTGTTTLISKSSSGVPGNSISEYASISANGRYVAYFSYATNLVAGDNNGHADIFVHDRDTGTTTLVSRNTAGDLGNQISLWPTISPDGRFVAFNSHATNLVPGDPGNPYPDVFLRDLQTNTTTLLAPNVSGGYGNIGTYVPTSISSDNRYVAFWATSTNLVSGDTNGYSDVFVRDRGTDTTALISVSTAGVQGNGRSEVPAISLDGRYVAFQSLATNLVTGDTNGKQDIFVRDLTAGTTDLVSKSSAGVAGNSNSGTPAISADGRYVAFFSSATNLVAGDTNGMRDVFVHDRQTNTTTRVSVSTAGAQGNANSLDAFISPDGRYVGFYSDASNLVANDTNGQQDIFVRDQLTGTTRSLTIWEPAPVADFTANQTSGDRPLAVQFTDSSTGSPTNWSWDFDNDGKTDSYDQNPVYTYNEIGSYSVNLTVTNGGGTNTAIKNGYISVNGFYYVYADGVSMYYDGSSDPTYEAVPIAEGFYTNISGKQGSVYSSYIWQGIGNPVNNATGSRNWNINEDADSMANNADFAFHAGHGWYNGLKFGIENYTYDMVRENMHFGGNHGRAKWVAFDSCSVLNEATQENWKSVFDGLHMLMSFDSEGVLEAHQGSQFAQRMTGSDIYDETKIADAWKATLKDTINDVSRRGAYMSAYPCEYDYLPGFGSFLEPQKDSNGHYNISYYSFDCGRESSS
jgi:PKD repeat protein